jgi:hypothetical protein
MQKWEYRVVLAKSGMLKTGTNLTEQLNELGNEGWELIAVLNAGHSLGTNVNYFLLKRPKQ